MREQARRQGRPGTHRFAASEFRCQQPTTGNQRYTSARPATPACPRVRRMQPDPAEIARQLAELRLQHRDLDVVIAGLQERPPEDELVLKRMKKRKLKLKDMIAQLESRLIPDMDA